MCLHSLGKLTESHPACVLWWDSSPLAHETWRAKVLGPSQQSKHAAWEADRESINSRTRLYFRKAFEFDGMTPSEFSYLAAFFATATAYRKSFDFVARVLEENRPKRVA